MSVLSLALWIMTSASSVAVAPQPRDVPSQLPQLQGTWQAESRVYQGRTEGAQQLKNLQLVIEGDRFTYHAVDGKQLRGALEFSGALEEVDTVIVSDSGEALRVPNRYRLEGDQLTVARPQGNAPERPRDFTSPPGSNVRVTVYRRDTGR